MLTRWYQRWKNRRAQLKLAKVLIYVIGEYINLRISQEDFDHTANCLEEALIDLQLDYESI